MFFEGKRLIVEEKKETVFFVEEKNNGEGKGGKYLEKEKEGNIWRRKRRKMFGEGKYIFCGGEIFWKRKMSR